ncbi:membrane protein [Corynebacterium falsenii DSM 44353]|uniref:DUF2304 domain-containing protein n=1 Tax=Corynebacterium falsenii TaxID=108486 RepID=A0A418Q543_9CORY|nr:DUF2304 domain-containing protein [Corynebacterium falsenii]AHI04020.1 membrane protein [Corynebacterium falsenii DSM 44353]MDC7104757.1 DUF2304 domain-containing protein [Corynebacterium falsenii]RIX33661.1 DUF2304 domain-containing protein [Corynebacterium falsenii]UBI04803.1 DUF2304 domain-containing protein [Corynebacterium falsenii]UBI07221.1 DUF2304 domain-containing protein [Corynebacterium falsenii]
MTGTTMLIQTLLLLAVLGLALYFLSNRKKARAKAGVKIGFVLFIILSVWTVLRPDDLTVVARWLGVSRGTDLLLYMLVVGFVFTTMSTYMRLREQELRYARLARAIALQNAVPPEQNTAQQNTAQPDNDSDSASVESSPSPHDNR